VQGVEEAGESEGRAVMAWIGPRKMCVGFRAASIALPRPGITRR
jgi:hypothetical protein